MSTDPLVTLFFVGDANPVDVLRTEPDSTPGFGRKYLAQLNPQWHISHIGNFDLNRSAPPGNSEFYIGGYPQLAVVQTVLPGLEKLTDVPPAFLNSIPATEIFGSLITDETGISGFTKWNGDGTVHRSFTASRTSIYEDIGLPYAFEGQFWDVGVPTDGFTLPFNPREIAQYAVEHWLGTPITPSGLDIPVAAFATDGRPSTVTENYASSLLPALTSFMPDDPTATHYDDYTPASMNTDTSTLEAEQYIDQAKQWLHKDTWKSWASIQKRHFSEGKLGQALSQHLGRPTQQEPRTPTRPPRTALPSSDSSREITGPGKLGQD